MDVIGIRIKYSLAFLLYISLSLLLISCHTTPAAHQTSIQESQSVIQQSINQNQALAAHQARKRSKQVDNALLPPLSHYVNAPKQGPTRFDVVANNIPAKEFFMGLIAGTPYNMVVSPNISGNISLSLKNVTIRQVMDAVRDMYGYEYQQTSYGFEVAPPKLETRIFTINYLDVQRKGRSYTQLTTGQVSSSVGTVTAGAIGSSTFPTQTPGTSNNPEGTSTISTIETKSEMKFWQDVEKTISGIVGTSGGRNVTVNSQTGIISIRAYPGELNSVARYINNMQSSLNRQVILEAKILEVELDDEYQAGIDWSILGNPALVDANGVPIDHHAGMGQDANRTFSDTDLKNLTGIFAVRIKGNFKLLINLLQTQGNVQVLSSPHISTVNNQKAVIKVGSDEFFVTGVSTSNTIVGTNTIPSQDVSLTPFFSGITLDVTPEISWDDTVVLHIHPSVSRVKEQTKTIGLGATSNGDPNNLTLPLAFSTIRESDNIVRAKNGQVVVIGGLMQNNMIETIGETPWLGNIPFIGAAFRRTRQISAKSELVILLRPIVASNKNIIENLQDKKQSFYILKRPFHFGSAPKVFGNEGERTDT